SRAGFDDYLNAIPAMSSWLAVGAEYSALSSFTPVTYHDPRPTRGTPTSPFDDAETQTYLADMIDAHNVPAATPGMVYFISIPANANWYDASLGGGVCTGAAGYHGIFSHGGQ